MSGRSCQPNVGLLSCRNSNAYAVGVAIPVVIRPLGCARYEIGLQVFNKFPCFRVGCRSEPGGFEALSLSFSIQSALYITEGLMGAVGRLINADTGNSDRLLAEFGPAELVANYHFGWCDIIDQIRAPVGLYLSQCWGQKSPQVSNGLVCDRVSAFQNSGDIEGALSPPQLTERFHCDGDDSPGAGIAHTDLVNNNFTLRYVPLAITIFNGKGGLEAAVSYPSKGGFFFTVCVEAQGHITCGLACCSLFAGAVGWFCFSHILANGPQYGESNAAINGYFHPVVFSNGQIAGAKIQQDNHTYCAQNKIHKMPLFKCVFGYEYTQGGMSEMVH